jgi:hypothetical protein
MVPGVVPVPPTAILGSADVAVAVTVPVLVAVDVYDTVATYLDACESTDTLAVEGMPANV